MAKDGSGYTINVTNVGYIGLDISKNSLNVKTGPVSGDSKYQWSFSYKSGIWVSNVGNSGRRLQWNSSASCFRCYTGSQEELTLYRRTTSTGGSTPSIPTPDPENPTPDPEDPDEPTTGPEDPDTPDVPPTTPLPGVTGVNGWYELPAMSYSKEGSYYVSTSDKYGKLYYAHHICDGGEKYAHGREYSGKDNTFIPFEYNMDSFSKWLLIVSLI